MQSQSSNVVKFDQGVYVPLDEEHFETDTETPESKLWKHVLLQLFDDIEKCTNKIIEFRSAIFSVSVNKTRFRVKHSAPFLRF